MRKKRCRFSNGERCNTPPTGGSPSTWDSRTISPSVTRNGGRKAMAEAARLPGSPAYLPGLASRMLSEAREPEAALSAAGDDRPAGERPRAAGGAGAQDPGSHRRAGSPDVGESRGNVPGEDRDRPGEICPLSSGRGSCRRFRRNRMGGNTCLEPGGKVRSDRVSQRLRVFQNQMNARRTDPRHRGAYRSRTRPGSGGNRSACCRIYRARSMRTRSSDSSDPTAPGRQPRSRSSTAWRSRTRER